MFLPTLIVIPHFGTSFYGADYQFPFSTVENIRNLDFLSAWSQEYVGERNFNIYQSFPVTIAYVMYFLGGYEAAPLLFVYVVISLYLLSFLFLTSTLLRAHKSKDPFGDTLVKGFVIMLAFISPVLMGYLTNYMTMSIVLATAFCIFSLGFLYRYIVEGDQKFFMLAFLPTLFIAHPPTFFFYLGSATFLLWIYMRFKEGFIFLFGSLVLASYWLIPMGSSFFVSDNVSMSADSNYIVHIFSWYSAAVSMASNHVFSIYPGNKLFEVVPHYVYAGLFLVLNLVIVSSLYISETSRLRKYLVSSSFLFIALMFFSYGKQFDTGVVFNFLWTHVSALHFFKSFTQILNIAFIFFCIILVQSLIILKEEYRPYTQVFIGSSILIVALGLIFYLPDVNKYLSRGNIPADYLSIRDVVNSKENLGRVFMLPEKAYPFYKWNSAKDQYFLNKTWFTVPVIHFSSIVPTTANLFKNKENDYTKAFERSGSNYLLVHRDYDEGRFRSTDFKFDYRLVDLIFESEHFYLYESKNLSLGDKLSITEGQIKFKKESSVMYSLQAEVTQNSVLIFKELYDRGWILWRFPLKDSCSINMLTALSKSISNGQGDYSLYHSKYDEFANQWHIGQSLDSENTETVCLVLYFTPQKYNYLYLLISLISLAYLLYKLLSTRPKYE